MSPEAEARVTKEAERLLHLREAVLALGVLGDDGTLIADVDPEDEAEWEREFSNPARVASFARWADESLARDKPRPIDPARL